MICDLTTLLRKWIT